MASEWRVSVSLLKRSRGKGSSPWQTAMSTLRSRVGSDIRVSSTKTYVFLYAASAVAAMQAEQMVREVLASTMSARPSGATAGTRSIRCGGTRPRNRQTTPKKPSRQKTPKHCAKRTTTSWTPNAKGRQPPGGRRGQVRVEPASRDEVKALARRLETEGWSVVRRRKYLVTGAACEDDAHALAHKIRGYTSVGTLIRVQPGVYALPGTGADLGLPGGIGGF
jgi:hypothetical protein